MIIKSTNQFSINILVFSLLIFSLINKLESIPLESDHENLNEVSNNNINIEELKSNWGNNPSPVIFVPGFGGSQGYQEPKDLENDWAKIKWVDVKSFIYHQDLTKTFRLHYDHEKKRPYQKPDQRVIFPGFGQAYPVANSGKAVLVPIPYLNPMIQAVQSTNYSFYKVDKTLLGATYDFRLSPRNNRAWAPSMKRLIENAVKETGQRVMIVGHSMGGLFMLYFLEKMTDDWKKQHIRAYVSVGTPYGGSVRMIKAYLTGENFDILVFQRQNMHELISSFEASQFLFPRSTAFPKDKKLVYFEKENKTFTFENLEELFTTMNDKDGLAMYKDTVGLVDGTKPPTGIDEIHCIYGTGLSTVSSLKFTSSKQLSSIYSKEMWGLGDGYVNKESLELCKTWPSVNTLELSRTNHLDAIGHYKTLRLLKKVANNGN